MSSQKSAQTPEPSAWPPTVYLGAGGVGVVVALPKDAMPTILHWGSDPGEMDEAELASIALPAVPDPATNAAGLVLSTAILPEGQTRWTGTPGLSGHRNGKAWSPRFIPTSVEFTSQGTNGGSLTVLGVDHEVQLQLKFTLDLFPSGVMRTQLSITNTGDGEYTVDSLDVALPVPARASTLIDFAGRWSKERTFQTRDFTVGTHLREGRHGRTGADAATLLMAATPNLNYASGEAWGMHVAFSGNHRTLAEHAYSGQRVLMGGELLLPGEVELQPGETYEAPQVYGVYGDGLDGVAGRLHSYMRSRPTHPKTDRPVVMNVWEAVYFNHDLDKLLHLADLAEQVGVERFVLDDGWFGSRRDDTKGLGDWTLSEEVWGGDKFKQLVDGVRSRGMQFGLWFEPEMVNMDSDLAREHPEWVLQVPGRLPREQRYQQVLDLSHPGAYQRIHDQMAAMIRDYDIDYIKWDHNRDLVDAGSTRTGRAGVHEQTLAVYRLMDQLKEEFPTLEIESCSSGGARVDLGVLERTDRVWASDCIDAIERQQIQRWTAQLIPLELIGSHVGADRAHTTQRLSDLEFRAATALFGHFGIEWDISSASPEEVEELTQWVAFYKQVRPLIHSGTLLRRDFCDGSLWLTGVISKDQSEALYSLSQMARSGDWESNRIQLPGLRRDAKYLVTAAGPNVASRNAIMMPPTWWAEGTVLSGATLEDIGLFVPLIQPDHAVLLHLSEFDR